MEQHHLKNRKMSQADQADQADDKSLRGIYPLAGTFLIGVVVGGLALAAMTN